MPTGTDDMARKSPADGEGLVAAAMAGDRDAVRALWEENRRWVAAVLLAHKPSFEDLDDLLQEVAMTLVSKLNTIREETNFRAWLRTVAVNAARAAGRSGKYRPRPFSRNDVQEDRFLSPESDRSVDEIIEDDDDLRHLIHRLAALPDTYREPLMLRAVRGMRSKQISDILDLPPATIDTRIARARRMLRESSNEVETTVGNDAETAS